MKVHTHYKKFNIELVTLILSIIALVLAVYVAYQYRVLNNEFESERKDNLELTTQLGEIMGEKLNLLELSAYQQSIIDSFQGQISNIGSTVGTLEKLSQTDPELLKKYSRVYFWNENYVPAKLAEIDNIYTYDGGTNFLIHSEVWPYLKKLLDAASLDRVELLVASAFRSFDTQATLKSEYKVTYGAGTANQFSADQGYSEHQLGTSIDFTTPAIAGVSSKFETDPAYAWLKDNAYKYGFVLSYPSGNTYYKFEPWHWRFVGVELASTLHRLGKYFYDFDQREIDVYLIKLFD